jgi:hypothetical protein
MTDAALHAGHDPDRVSFVAALRITRATIAQPGAFPPEQHQGDNWVSPEIVKDLAMPLPVGQR